MTNRPTLALYRVEAHATYDACYAARAEACEARLTALNAYWSAAADDAERAAAWKAYDAANVRAWDAIDAYLDACKQE